MNGKQGSNKKPSDLFDNTMTIMAFPLRLHGVLPRNWRLQLHASHASTTTNIQRLPSYKAVFRITKEQEGVGDIAYFT